MKAKTLVETTIRVIDLDLLDDNIRKHAAEMEWADMEKKRKQLLQKGTLMFSREEFKKAYYQGVSNYAKLGRFNCIVDLSVVEHTVECAVIKAEPRGSERDEEDSVRTLSRRVQRPL